MKREKLKVDLQRTAAEHLTELNVCENRSDVGNARRFARQWQGEIRYCYPWKRWLCFDGKRWVKDEGAEVERRAKETIEAMFVEAADLPDYERKAQRNHALKSESAARIRSMIALAQSEPGIPVRVEELDADPWLFNVANGTIELKSGKLREHRAEDLITKLSPVEFDPSAMCPTFEAFLKRIFSSRPDLIAYVQRAVGYSLTAVTSEHVLVIEHGTGANGKSTLNSAIEATLADYAISTPPETLMVKYGDGGISNDVARLCGARFVSASESEDGRRLAEAKIKLLTGGDKVAARFLRCEFFEFIPKFKLWFATNHKPTIRGTDEAIWRRIHLLPFDVTIPKEERVPDYFQNTLALELPGILAWAVVGCLKWQERGLDPPPEVQSATSAYRTEQDVVAEFIATCCIVKEDLEAPAGQLYNVFKRWTEGEGNKPLSNYSFGLRLTDKGFPARKASGGRKVRVGIGLLEEAGL